MSKRTRIYAAAALTLITCSSALLFAEDWPQWRGRDRSNRSPETGLLKAWSNDGPRRLWLYEQAGLGYSGPAVAEGLLLLLGTRGDQEVLIAVDAETGTEQWTVAIGEILENRWGDGPRGTPTIDGRRAYALSGRGNLVCVDLDQQRIVWQATMQQYGGRQPNWGYCESVLVDGNAVICTPGGDQGAILALNKETGEPLWQSKEFTDEAHYASLIIAEINGRRQYIQLTAEHLVGIAAESGELLWSTDFPGRTATIPTPVARDNYVFATAGYGAGCKLVRIEPDFQVTVVYENKNMKNHHGGVVLVGDHIYGYSDNIGWICLDFATGEIVWKERDALDKGALTYADGMLYCLGEGEGQVVLIEASPAGWKPAGRFQLNPQSTQRSPQGRIWTHPVIANGKLYLRDQEFLYCYDIQRR